MFRKQMWNLWDRPRVSHSSRHSKAFPCHKLQNRSLWNQMVWFRCLTQTLPLLKTVHTPEFFNRQRNNRLLRKLSTCLLRTPSPNLHRYSNVPMSKLLTCPLENLVAKRRRDNRVLRRRLLPCPLENLVAKRRRDNQVLRRRLLPCLVEGLLRRLGVCH